MSDARFSLLAVDPWPLQGRYRTPANAPAGIICRRILVPDDAAVRAALSDVISRLTVAEVWQQVEPTDATPEEMAASVTQMLYDLWGNDCMIGSIVPFVTANPPDFGLLCDGSTHLKADYPALYEKLDSAYIVDADSFRTPDLRGKFVLGASLSHAVNSNGGAETHTLTTDEIPAHAHTTQPHSHSYNYPTINVDLEAPGVPDITGAGNPPVPMATSSTIVQVDQTGGGQAHNNMPPYIALNYYIIAR